MTDKEKIAGEIEKQLKILEKEKGCVWLKDLTKHLADWILGCQLKKRENIKKRAITDKMDNLVVYKYGFDVGEIESHNKTIDQTLKNLKGEK